LYVIVTRVVAPLEIVGVMETDWGDGVTDGVRETDWGDGVTE
jgi:hypothetical protein